MMDSYASSTVGHLPNAVPIDKNSNHSLISSKFPSWVLLPAHCCRCCWMSASQPIPSGSAPDKTFEMKADPGLQVGDAIRFSFRCNFKGFYFSFFFVFR